MESPLPAPALTDGETASYRGTIGGEEVGDGTVTVRVDGEHVEQTIAAQAFGRLAVATTVGFRTKRGQLLAESVITEMLDRGRRVLREEVALRDGQVVQVGGEAGPFPRAVVPVHGAWVALRALELETGARFELPMWLASVAHWPVSVEVLPAEEIAVPAGTIEARKLLLRPSLAQLGPLEELARSVVPPVVAHVETAATQRLVRLAFPTGPRREDPKGLLEATALD